MQCLSIKKMYFRTIASGSKGNSSIVLCGDTRLLIDDGISYLTLKRNLESMSLDFSMFKGILITHSHSDHVKGLESLLKHTKLKVLIPEEMYHELKDIVPKYRVIFIKEINKLDDVKIEVFNTSHDTDISVGYIITYNDKTLVYITDTGYLNKKLFKKLSNKNIYLMECNHDEEMLRNGPYPPFLKSRVLSDHGHLSNKLASSYLKQFVTENTKYIFLAHLSEKNNTEELAMKEVLDALKDKNIKVYIAKQDEMGKLVEV